MSNKTRGFTLIELMIAIAIIGILTAIALPAYNKQVAGSRRSDCMATMMGFAQAMEKFYAVNYTYDGVAETNKKPKSSIYPAQCPTVGTAHYTLTVESADANSFIIQATPLSTSPNDGDGLLQANHLGQRFWDKNDDNDVADTGENRWER